MIVELGWVDENQGKIIGVYPSNKMIELKELMQSFRRSELMQNNIVEQRSNIKSDKQVELKVNQIVLEQEKFFRQLKQFQFEFEERISRKLSEVKHFSGLS